jgi:hypothetical protein
MSEEHKGTSERNLSIIIIAVADLTSITTNGEVLRNAKVKVFAFCFASLVRAI